MGSLNTSKRSLLDSIDDGSVVKIGIDCGNNTGMALSVEGKMLLTWTTEFWEAYELCVAYKSRFRLKVYVEDPGQIKKVFPHPGIKPYQLLAKAQHVGGVKARSSEMIRGLKRKGVRVVGTKPSNTKKNAKFLSHHFGWTSATNPHERDAFMIIVGL